MNPTQRLAEHYKDQIVFVKLFGNANRQTKDLFKGRFQVGPLGSDYEHA